MLYIIAAAIIAALFWRLVQSDLEEETEETEEDEGWLG